MESNPLYRLDDYILRRYQSIAQAVRQRLGWNNFQLARRLGYFYYTVIDLLSFWLSRETFTPQVLTRRTLLAVVGIVFIYLGTKCVEKYYLQPDSDWRDELFDKIARNCLRIGRLALLIVYVTIYSIFIAANGFSWWLIHELFSRLVFLSVIYTLSCQTVTFPEDDTHEKETNNVLSLPKENLPAGQETGRG